MKIGKTEITNGTLLLLAGATVWWLYTRAKAKEAEAAAAAAAALAQQANQVRDRVGEKWDEVARAGMLQGARR